MSIKLLPILDLTLCNCLSFSKDFGNFSQTVKNNSNLNFLRKPSKSLSTGRTHKPFMLKKTIQHVPNNKSNFHSAHRSIHLWTYDYNLLHRKNSISAYKCCLVSWLSFRKSKQIALTLLIFGMLPRSGSSTYRPTFSVIRKVSALQKFYFINFQIFASRNVQTDISTMNSFDFLAIKTRVVLSSKLIYRLQRMDGMINTCCIIEIKKEWW